VHLTGSTDHLSGQVRLLPAVIDPQTRLGMVRVSLTPMTTCVPERLRAPK
jgi:hypothetical protein